MTKLPHAADEYDEGLQRTPELERQQQTSVACRFLLEASYHTRRVVAATTEQVSHNKQQANHDDDDSRKTNEAEAAAAAAAAAVAARPPSPQTNDPRITKETHGNGYRKKVKYKRLLLKFRPRHRGHCRADLSL